MLLLALIGFVWFAICAMVICERTMASSRAARRARAGARRR